MAIDYGNYAQIYGQGPDLSPIQEGISNYMEKSKEALNNRVSRENEDAWAGFMKPWQDAMSADVGSWNPDTFKMKDAGTALANYKADALKKGNKFYNALAAQGAFNPVAFKEQYDQLKTTYMPQIEKKLETYKSMNHYSNKVMKEKITEMGMNEFLLNYGDEAGNAREWAMPKQDWKQWGTGKLDEYGIWRPALGVAGTVGTAKGIVQRGVGGTLSAITSPKAKGMEKLVAGEGMIGKRIKGSKYVAGMDKTFARHQSKAKDLVTKATKLKDDAFDRFRKGKGKNTKGFSKKLAKFEASAAGKKHLARIKKAQVMFDKKTAQVTKGAWSVIQKKLKEKGASGLLKEIAKKAGWKTAAKMGARLGIGTAATFSGVGTAAGIAMNAYLVWDLYKILTSD